MPAKTIKEIASEFRAGEYKPHTLNLIERLASEGKTQPSIAAALGITRKEFTNALEAKKGINDVRLAWERGQAVVEQQVADTMRQAAFGEEEVTEEVDEETGEKIKVITRTLSKSATILAIFYAKARLGWKESDKDQQSNNQGGPTVQLVLPQPMSADQYFKMVGAPVDVRPQEMKDVSPRGEQQSLAAMGPLAKIALAPPESVPVPTEKPNE